MKKGSLLTLSIAIATLFLMLDAAHARPPYKKEWDAKYVKKGSTVPEEKALADAVEVAKCNVCHMGTEKKNHNAYGKELKKLLTKDDVKDTAKQDDAFDKVAAMHSNPDDPNSPTFGDLIKQGKLPGGDAK